MVGLQSGRIAGEDCDLVAPVEVVATTAEVLVEEESVVMLTTGADLACLGASRPAAT